MIEIWGLIIITIALIIGIWLFKYKIEKRPEVDASLQENSVLDHVPQNLIAEIKYMDRLNGYEFEDYTAWLLRLNGFVRIKQTNKNHDNGLDVLASVHQTTYGIQCKHYKKRRIRRQVIKHTADGAHFYGTQRAVVLTNTRFSREAVRSRKFFHVELWGRPNHMSCFFT
ncbi:MAG: restriction endonuclease [Acetilactobacillus jinshanensis]